MFDCNSNFCSNCFGRTSSYVGAGWFAEDGGFCICFRQWRPHKQPKIENKIEVIMNTLIVEAVAITPSWLNGLPVNY